MSKKLLKNKDIVLTGQYLGVVEEFLPDKQTTFIKEGQIYATKSGLINIDEKKRKIEIKTHQEKDRKVVKKGDIVIGTILFLRQYSVGVSFYTVNNKIHFNSYYFGNIHVSQISDRYIDKIYEAFQITDILRARVIEQNYNEYKLSTVGKSLGVIYADCMICGTPLKKIGYNKLRCQRCGNVETRKIANDYGNVNESLRF
ncbi:MAG: exosome complex RNA-binding protein Csl4 [Candidatus Lokiarchaeota archaeon]|nr:exosome complex RNA-binding protein Csl4 [Candidatus Lokiarchaeota archaeon]